MLENLKKYLAREIPLINAVLAKEIASLPPSILEVAQHVLNAGGKRLRPFLVLLMARALGYAKEDVYPLACALEIFHSATLIHDDVLDEAELRRGQTASHIQFGNKRAILAGDGLLALGNLIVARYNNPLLTQVVSEAILATAYGEIEEIAFSKNKIDKETYFRIISGKTAYLIQAACECGAILSGSEDLVLAAKSYGFNLGVAFQLIDDVLDYTQSHEIMGKPQLGDLREGKITLPLIYYVETLSLAEQEEFWEKFFSFSFEEEELEEILLTIKEKEISERVKTEAKAYLDKARKSLEAFPESKEKEILNSILTYIVEREK